MKQSSDIGEKARIRVLIVDDHGGWRGTVLSLLSREPGLQVLGEAADGFEAVQQAKDLSPDLVLMDIGMPGLNGIQAARRILNILPECKVLLLTEFRSAKFVEEAMSNGATGYVIKSRANSELIPAIQLVMDGKFFISDAIEINAKRPAIEGLPPVIPSRPNPFAEFAGSPAIQGFLESVVLASGADFGNVQLFDSANKVLRIVAHVGFQSEFLEYFASVAHEHNTVCSGAMARRQRVVVTDISKHPFASSHATEVLQRAQVHSCQSTPLHCRTCGFMGVVSSHYTRPGGPPPDVLPRIDELAAGFIAHICG
jgi:DNA-binding NarL/FixJ family response regulator